MKEGWRDERGRTREHKGGKERSVTKGLISIQEGGVILLHRSFPLLHVHTHTQKKI